MSLHQSMYDRTEMTTCYEERPGPTPLFERMESLDIQIWLDCNPENAIKSERYISEIVVPLCQNARNLQSLKIRQQFYYYDDNSIDTSIDLPRNLLENAPSLQTLKFELVSPPANSTFFLPNLTRINWFDPALKTPASFEDLLNFFESSPQLEFIWISVRTLPGQPSKEVTLKNLLEFEWTDRYGSNSLVPYIIAPKLTRLEINLASDRNPQQAQPTTPSSILPSDRVHIPLLSEPTTMVYVCNSYQGCALHYPACGHKLRVFEHKSQEDPSNWFSRLVHPISFSMVHKLGIESLVGYSPPVDFPIREFENLNELYLRGNVELLLPILLGPKHDEQEPCIPKLSKIHISDCPNRSRFTLSTLTDILRQRKEAGCTAVRIVCIPRLYHEDPDIEALREVAGDVFFNPDVFDYRALNAEYVFPEAEEDRISDSSWGYVKLSVEV